jgi:hypothetical protein
MRKLNFLLALLLCSCLLPSGCSSSGNTQTGSDMAVDMTVDPIVGHACGVGTGYVCPCGYFCSVGSKCDVSDITDPQHACDGGTTH